MNPKISLFVRVAKRRLLQGQKLDDILDSWKNLSPEEKEEIKSNLSA